MDTDRTSNITLGNQIAKVIKALLTTVFPIVISALPCRAQQIDLFGSVNRTDFYDGGEAGHYRSTLVNKSGYSFGVAVDSLFKFPLGIIFQYDRYGGEVTASNGGLGSGYTVDVSVRKSIISLMVLPIRIRVSPKFGIGLGFGYSHLIDESYEGTRSDWSGFMPLTTIDLQDAYNEFSSSGYFGLLARMAYNIPLSASVYLTPHFGSYVGLENEFHKFPTSIKSIRYQLGFGIKKDFNRS